MSPLATISIDKAMHQKIAYTKLTVELTEPRAPLCIDNESLVGVSSLSTLSMTKGSVTDCKAKALPKISRSSQIGQKLPLNQE